MLRSAISETEMQRNVTIIENLSRELKPDFYRLHPEPRNDATVRFLGSKKFGLLVRISWPVQMIGR